VRPAELHSAEYRDRPICPLGAQGAALCSIRAIHRQTVERGSTEFRPLPFAIAAKELVGHALRSQVAFAAGMIANMFL
jgi:hypothetical protein